ncbi:hypothetical protein GCM10022240_12250 [Microbacterium kribbense]|uniref:Lipoprotein with Yx(FWY)xxD motif n=1 Tax=Microbacterium kribbense TaxID=433645 RepID=A0ABP7GBW7_9MICO
MRIPRALTALALATSVLGAGALLSGCAAPTGPQVVLKVMHSTAGDVVADADGHAVYLYAKDTQNSGESVCDSACLASWPAVTTTSTSPGGAGLSGTVGEIPLSGGHYQVTFNGWPLYTFDGDVVADTIKGQGAGGVWWLLSPNGERVTEIGR